MVLPIEQHTFPIKIKKKKTILLFRAPHSIDDNKNNTTDRACVRIFETRDTGNNYFAYFYELKIKL